MMHDRLDGQARRRRDLAEGNHEEVSAEPEYAVRLPQAQSVTETLLATRSSPDPFDPRHLASHAAHVLVDPGFLFEPNQTVAMRAVVDAALALAHADKGNLQVLDTASGGLRIVAQRGFDQDFLDFFAIVDGPDTACGSAMAHKASVTVENVSDSEIFDGTTAQTVVLKTGVRAVHSTPIVDLLGAPIGVLSVHYRQPRRPSGGERYMLATLARRAGLWIQADSWIKAAHHAR
jgi:hypothetical protein